MRAIRKPKIGLAGVMCTPFRGDKEGNYRGHVAALQELANRLDFDFFALEQGIYSAEEAGSAAARLRAWGADFVLLQASSFAAGDFVYPFTELPARLGIWAVPEGPPSAEGGLPLNSFTAANLYNSIIRTHLTAYPWPVKWFLGHPGQPLLDQRLEITVRALRALVNLRGGRIGLVGGVAPSFDNLIIDERKLKARLEMGVVHIELDQLLQKARQADQRQAARLADEIRASAAQFDESQSEGLEKSGQVGLALQALAAEYDLQAVAVSCWPRFQSDFHFAVCSVMGHMNTGGLAAACEGDITSAASMLALRYLTNGEVVTLMDLSAVDSSDESVLLWHCGPTSPALADERGARMESLWLFDRPGSQPTGLHNDLVLRPGPGTVLGFNTDFDRMLVLDGVIDNAKPSYVGSRGWFKDLRLNTHKINTSELVQTLMVSGFQHHYPFAYGWLAEAGLELCAWLGIQPIPLEPYTAYVK
jgi:hypothetical protein